MNLGFLYIHLIIIESLIMWIISRYLLIIHNHLSIVLLLLFLSSLMLMRLLNRRPASPLTSNQWIIIILTSVFGIGSHESHFLLFILKWLLIIWRRNNILSFTMNLVLLKVLALYHIHLLSCMLKLLVVSIIPLIEVLDISI